MDKVIVTIVVLFLAFMVQYLWQLYRIPSIEAILENIGAPDELGEHSKEYSKREVVQVTKGVYAALNYAIANCIMLLGTDGKVIVDTTENLDAAREIAADFKKITQLETKGILYTHHHSDHCTGSEAFLEENQEYPQIWAHRLFPKEEKRVLVASRAHYNRAMYQFGTHLGKFQTTNAGLGGKLNFTISKKMKLPPTHFVDDYDTNLVIAGINMTVMHIPGETADQIGVWLPEERVFLCADDLYKAFPNLYAIRGVTPRDVMEWARSLDKIRKLRPHCLVGSHGKPVCGEEIVYELLSNYMYGIQYVHDQTVRYINKGMHPDQIAKTVQLPPELAKHPYLMQYYGTVHWSVKAVYIMYMGWFSGEAVDLDPLTPVERAEQMVKLVGYSGLLKAAAAALAEKDYQWALELATHIHRLEPSNSWAKQIRRDCMARLAEQQMSAPGRNFYMTEIMNDEEMFSKENYKGMINAIPLSNIFQAMPTRLKVEDLPANEHMKGCFVFTDTNTIVCATIEKSVMTLCDKLLPEWDFKLVTTEGTFKAIIVGEKWSLTSYLGGGLTIEGSAMSLRRFMSYIEI